MQNNSSNIEGLSLERATEVLLANTVAPTAKEELPLLEALGCVAAEDVRADFDNPPFDRSPLDGYAIIAADTAGATRENRARLRVIGEECAGDFFAGTVARGETVRIMTGAAMPKGTDAVVRQEDVTTDGDYVFVPREFRTHENYCFAGEDIKAGSAVIKRGETLTAARLAVLASLGRANVAVWRKPRVVIASTGDELVLPGEPLKPGKIYNSNLFLLAGRLREIGFSPTLAGTLPDDAELAAAKIKEYADADVFITTGGVSVGKKDIMHDTVKRLDAGRLFWRVLMKPGAPVLAYRAGKTLGLALSGNPFAAYATFELLARPVLAKLCGKSEVFLPRCRAILADNFPKPSHGRRFVRAILSGECVNLPERHNSGSLFSAIGCNALIDIPAGTGALAAGSEVEVVML